MNGKKARRLRREFREAHGRAPERAQLGGKVTRFVDRELTDEEKATRKLAGPIRVVATLFSQVARPSEWRAWKRARA